MAKRKRKSVPNGDLLLLELQLAILSHTVSLKAVTRFLEAGNETAAVARLDQAVNGLHAIIRGQCVGVTKSCPGCGTQQDVVAWVDDGACDNCGAKLEIPDDGV